MPQSIKNAGSVMALPKIFDIIKKTLINHKARHITESYDEQGRIAAIAFVLSINERDVPFRLPARVANVEKILYPNTQARWLSKTQKGQTYRVAWANIRDWIGAQCALIDTGMVKAEEVFLPYMLNQGGQTFFEVMEEQRFLLLPPPEQEASA